MKREDLYYSKAEELIVKFINFNDTHSQICQDMASRKDVSYALAMLQDSSGILRKDFTLAKLCADCFIFGVFMATKPSTNGNYQKLVDVLKGQMKLSAGEAKDAASFATGQSPDGNMAELLKLALRYHGNGDLQE